MADHFIDTKGLSCPLPILEAKKAIVGIAVGETLEVHSTDAGAIGDFEAFCRRTKHELLEQTVADDVYRFVIKKVG